MAVCAFKSATKRRCAAVTPTEGHHNGSYGYNYSQSENPNTTATSHHHNKQYNHRRHHNQHSQDLHHGSLTASLPSTTSELSPCPAGNDPQYRSHAHSRSRAVRRTLDRQLSEISCESPTRRPNIDRPKHEAHAMWKEPEEFITPLKEPYEASLHHVLEASPQHKRSNRRYHGKHRGSEQYYPEGQVEEKFVLTIHPQNEPQCSDILSRDQIFELYRIIKAEIMLTVGEVKNVVENDQDKLWLLDCSCESIDISNSTTISGEEIFKAFKYMCKSYTTKVEKAEEEVKALRARLIEQELKYLDLTNFVNELASDNLALQRSIGIENEVESPLIDDKNYMNCLPRTSYRSFDDDDRVSTCQVSSHDSLVKLKEEPSSREKDEDNFDCNKDGLVLPWLQWDATNNPIQCYSVRNFGGKQESHLMLNMSPDLDKEQDMMEESCSYNTIVSQQWQEISNIEDKEAAFEKAKSTKVVETKADDTKCSDLSETSFVYIKNMELVSERTQFKSRIESRELLLCIGTWHYMFW